MDRDAYLKLLGVAQDADQETIMRAWQTKQRENQIRENSPVQEVREQAAERRRQLLEARRLLLSTAGHEQRDAAGSHSAASPSKPDGVTHPALADRGAVAPAPSHVDASSPKAAKEAVVPARCSRDKKDFHILFEKDPAGDWTYSRCDLPAAGSAGSRGTAGSCEDVEVDNPDFTGYEGCPVCGNGALAQCPDCKGLGCWGGRENRYDCPHCGGSFRSSGSAPPPGGVSLSGTQSSPAPRGSGGTSGLQMPPRGGSSSLSLRPKRGR